MKKNVLALGIAAAVAGFAGSAFAVSYAPGAAGNPAGFNADAGSELRVSTTGEGHMLVVPYFSAQNGNKTLLSLTNTTDVAKAVKVRFRGAANSDDLYDFQVFLSPGDVWTADIHQGADGFAALSTSDKSCTKPTVVGQSFKGTRLQPLWAPEVQQSNTREGYIEIFNMADIVPGSNLDKAVVHTAGVPLCGAELTGVWTAIDNPAATTATLGAQMQSPTTGLMANWTIINVPNATAWSGAAAAVQVTTAAGAPAAGNVVYAPQVNAAYAGGTAALTAGESANWTADPLLNPSIQISGAAQFDLPDMSTPYSAAAGTGAGAPEQQAADLSGAIATTAVMNEFWTLDGISGATDWVFSMPTRRYSVAVKYGNPSTIAKSGIAGAYFNDGATGNIVWNADKGDILCVNGISNKYWDREEGTNIVSAGDTSSSPGDAAPTPAAFCGETSVLSINDVSAGSAPTKVLGGEVTVRNFNLTIGGQKVQEGWMNLGTPGLSGGAGGLPILGGSFMSAFNPEVTPGVAGNFNMMFPHRTARP